MVTTDDAALHAGLKSLSNQGRSDTGDWLEHDRLGFNYRLDDVSAAIGVGQVERLDALLASRAAVAARYDDAAGRASRASRRRPWSRATALVVRVRRGAASAGRPQCRHGATAGRRAWPASRTCRRSTCSRSTASSAIARASCRSASRSRRARSPCRSSARSPRPSSTPSRRSSGGGGGIVALVADAAAPGAAGALDDFYLVAPAPLDDGVAYLTVPRRRRAGGRRASGGRSPGRPATPASRTRS